MPHKLSPPAFEKLLQTFQVPGYKIRLLSPEDVEAVDRASQVVTNVFLVDEPLTVALATDPLYGKKISHMEEYWRVLCERSAEQGLLMVAEAADGTFGAASVGVEYGTPLALSNAEDKEGPIPPFYDILTKLDPVIESHVDHYNATSSQPARTLELYANATLPSHRGHGLTTMMDSALAAIGILQGFTHVTVKLTSPWQAAWLSYGIPYVQEIDYRTYEFEGKHPFATIPKPQGVRSLWVEIALLQILVRPVIRKAELASKRVC